MVAESSITPWELSQKKKKYAGHFLTFFFISTRVMIFVQLQWASASPRSLFHMLIASLQHPRIQVQYVQEVSLESPINKYPVTEVLIQESANASLGIISLKSRAQSIARKVHALAVCYSLSEIFEDFFSLQGFHKFVLERTVFSSVFLKQPGL